MNRHWYKMAYDEGTGTAEIRIDNEIGYWGVTAADFRKDLKALGDVKQIDLRINSPGGSTVDGFAIFNMLRDHPARITARIDGWAASMASVVAMAGDEIVMPENTWMMIHNPWTIAMGESEELRKMADILDSIKGHLVNAYRLHTNLSEDDLVAAMDAETWMDGKTAHEMGFATQVVDTLEAVATIRSPQFRNVPPEAMAWAKTKEDTNADSADLENGDGGSTADTGEEPDTGATFDHTVIQESIDAAYDEGLLAGRGQRQSELQAEVERKQAEIEDLTKQNASLNRSIDDLHLKLSRLLPGMGAPGSDDDSPDSFSDAVSRLAESGLPADEAYITARKKYPKLYEASRKAALETRKPRP